MDSDPGVRLDALDLVYQFLARDVQDNGQDNGAWVCEPRCAACCGDRVQMTWLEGLRLRRALLAAGRSDILEAASRPASPASRPRYTTNDLAAMCLDQREPPVEDPPAQSEVCPLLADGLCLAYDDRPLACRTMLSTVRCATGGEARIDPWQVTLSTMLFQVVEHMALGGGFGLMGDVLAAGGEPVGLGLLTCRPLPGLPAPAEHADRLNEAVRGLLGQTLENKPLGIWIRDWGAEAGGA